ncbi:MAG: hypothetical protein WKG01_10200 [Kofleriaceae bacterium]
MTDTRIDHHPTTDWPDLPQELIDPAIQHALGAGITVERWLSRDGVVVALFKHGLRYLANGEVKTLATRSHGNRAWLARGGSHLLIENGIDLLRVTLPDGKATTFPKPIPGFQLVPIDVAGDQLAARTLSGVLLLHETDDGLEITAELELVGTGPLLAACNGRLLLMPRARETELVAVGPGILRSIGTLPFAVSDLRCSIDRLIVREPAGLHAVFNLVTRLDEALTGS